MKEWLKAYAKAMGCLMMLCLLGAGLLSLLYGEIRLKIYSGTVMGLILVACAECFHMPPKRTEEKEFLITLAIRGRYKSPHEVVDCLRRYEDKFGLLLYCYIATTCKAFFLNEKEVERHKKGIGNEWTLNEIDNIKILKEKRGE